MKILQEVTKNSLIFNFFSWYRAYQQERRVQKDIEYYNNIAKERGIIVPTTEELKDLLAKRLTARGIHPSSKKRGDLHIFLAFGKNSWEFVLPLALSEYGKVTEFSWESTAFFNSCENWLKWRSDLNSRMISEFKKANSQQQIDVMVGYLSEFNTTRETLDEIARQGVIIFNMNWDDKLYFGGRVNGQLQGVKNIVSSIDLNLTNSPDSCIKYLVLGSLATFWPEAAFPVFHRPYSLPFKYDVTFVGRKYGWRTEFITKLHKKGINLRAFGLGWESRTLSSEDMVKLYSQSRINLGFSGVGYSKKVMCLKGRDFEIPMSGGLYFTQNNPELSRVYDIGKEIVTYKNLQDCADKIKWLLANPEVADKIRNAGRRRALDNHTWKKRFSDIFKMAGLLIES